MKSVFSALIAALLSSQAFAGEPNLFICKNDQEKLQISYSTTSFVGSPTFKIMKDQKDLLNGTETNRLEATLVFSDTPFGNLVTAEVVRPLLADAPAILYGVVIPSIDLGNSARATFETVLIEGTSGGFRSAPAVYQEVTKTTGLTCEAKKVFF